MDEINKKVFQRCELIAKIKQELYWHSYALQNQNADFTLKYFQGFSVECYLILELLKTYSIEALPNLRKEDKENFSKKIKSSGGIEYSEYEYGRLKAMHVFGIFDLNQINP